MLPSCPALLSNTSKIFWIHEKIKSGRRKNIVSVCKMKCWSAAPHRHYVAAPLIWRKCPVWAVPSHAQLPVFSLLCAVTTKTITHSPDCLLSSQWRQRFYNTQRSTLYLVSLKLAIIWYVDYGQKNLIFISFCNYAVTFTFMQPHALPSYPQNYLVLLFANKINTYEYF